MKHSACALPATISVGLGVSLLVWSHGAQAQIMGGWTQPVPAPPPGTVPASGPAPRRAPETVVAPGTPTPATPNRAAPFTGRSPFVTMLTPPDASQPVVLFTARTHDVAPAVEPPAPSPAPSVEPPRYAISYQAERDTAAWQVRHSPAPLDRAPQNLDQPVQLASPRDHRGPWTRIWQGTDRAVMRDLPEAIAGSLPWVDPERKAESTEDVLSRVAWELSNAHNTDPEWILPAERELRALDTRLRRMPTPPLVSDTQPLAQSGQIDVPRSARAFRPRPVWPGASAAPEPQVRPATLTTYGLEETGPAAPGVTSAWTPPEEAEPAATPAPRARGRGGRRP